LIRTRDRQYDGVPRPRYPVDRRETLRFPQRRVSFWHCNIGRDRTAADKLSLVDMTRLILKAIDLGASAVFMALFTKAFFFHFYKDVKRLTVEPLALPPQKSTLKRQGDVTNII
jgi:hypothetical protein